MSDSIFTLRRNAVMQAGAGTGKTHSLVTLCLHLLGGVGRDEPLPPAKLWAVTFTEKAAAELKARLRQRIDALACGRGHEPELLRTCEELGRPLPPREVWRRALRDLAVAQVGTIHSLCAQLLRRHAPAAGLDPAFAVLDEREASRLLEDCSSQAVLHALDGVFGPAEAEAARRLCVELGFRARHQFGSGAADEVRKLLLKLGETGREPAELVAETPGLDTARAEASYRDALAALSRAVDVLSSAAKTSRGTGKTGEKAVEVLRQLSAGVLGKIASQPPGHLAAAWDPLGRAREQTKGNLGAALAEPMKAVGVAIEALADADAATLACGFARDLAAVAGRALALYRAEKTRRDALDFDDLTRLARDLLAKRPAARTLERTSVGVLVVDEFQDTSRTQLELFSWLVGDGQPGTPVPGTLVVVGDRKQSIYDFRGADVAGSQAFAQAALAAGALRHVLGESRRSRPALVELANLVFESALQPSGQPFQTPFTPDDALTAHRAAGPPGPCAELMDVSGKGVEAEAEAVARRIAALLAPGATERVFDGEVPRPPRGGDVAILLRRFTNLETFRRALLRFRIPHLVYKGRGFHSAREVLDLVALLTAALDPDDALAIAAVLRSPLGPVSDDGLVLLAGDAGLSGRSLTDAGALSALAADDREAVTRVRNLLSTLRKEADRLGPAALLEGALEATDYRASCAGGLHGEQAAANIDKLVALARAAELRGESMRAFLFSLRELADEEAREPDAPVVEERDPHAVRLMTVHAAKGLEFPVVFIPECGSRLVQTNAGRVCVDPGLGLALRVGAADGERRWGRFGQEVSDLRGERELAQARRLLYVAVTRARDFVVLSSTPPKFSETWRKYLDPVVGEAVRRGLLVQRTDAPPVERRPRDGAPVDDEGLLTLAAAAAEEAPAELPPGDGAHTISAAVTQLADASLCARRYRFLHELRLEERPGQEAAEVDPLGDEPGRPATALGTLAHRLLELVALDLPATRRREELQRLLSLEGESPEAHRELIDAAEAFLASPLGARMAQAKSGRLERELPFTLELDPDGAGPSLLLRGQIDALLVEGDRATVIDYKLSQARDPGRYAAQLDAYALAARQIVPGATDVRTGIVFLRTKGAPFRERESAPDPAAIRARLLAAAGAIAGGRGTGAWPGIERAHCEEIGCGFVPTCHPGPRGGGSAQEDAEHH